MASYPAEKDMKQVTDSDSDPNTGFGEVRNTVNNDAVFGEITEDGPNYRNVRKSFNRDFDQL